jgi:FlaA1/EpsC-like NDP-sugar epimerase
MEKIVSYFLRLTSGKVTRFISKQRKFCVLILNIGTILCSLLISLAIRFEFSIPPIYIDNFVKTATIFVLVKMVLIHFFKLNRGLWRYISMLDISNIFKANLFSSVILMFIFYGWRNYICATFPMSVIVIDLLICFLAMSFIRGSVRLIREINDNIDDSPLIRTIVVGKLTDVDTFLHGIKGSKTGRKIIAIFGPEKNPGATIRGIKIKEKLYKIAHYAKAKKIKEIILIPPYSRKRFLNLLVKQFGKIDYTCSLKIVPGAGHLTKGEINFSNIRKVKIEDLLGRPPVKFDHLEVASLVSKRTIMVTGGGGSIGSELCFQICKYQPEKIVVFEFCEYNLYEIERKLKFEFPDQQIEAVLGDVRCKNSLSKAIKNHSIEVIYHAAAYKHVPLLEKNILMGVHTNVIGTSNVADCAEECGVKRVVMISTDKAVRPTSIMGATKRVAEKVVLEREASATDFVVVRFGNVLGSRGSVVPLFKKQIEAGGPVTVTSKDMIRYFMSIPEAAELVLQAGTIGKDRDIMILEMGEQVNIYEMAKHLIKLSGFMPHRDIKIEFTGMRPGEKEYEELLTKEEQIDLTPFDRICVARKGNVEGDNVKVEEILKILQSGQHDKFRDICQSYIPENLLTQHVDEL